MAVVINKETGTSSTFSDNTINISSSSVIKLAINPKAISSYQKEGNDLLIHLHNGQSVRIINFYTHQNDIVLEDDKGKLWLGQHSDGLADFNFAEIQSVDQLAGGAGDFSPILLGILGLGAGAAIIAAASSSDDDDGPYVGDGDDAGTGTDTDTDTDIDTDTDSDEDAEGPDTTDTVVTIGTLTDDGVINLAESGEDVAVIVTLTGVPEDAASTQVTVFVDGQSYIATDNGDGTWTALVPGSDLVNASTSEVRAEAIFTDAAGNASAPVEATQSYDVDVEAPETTLTISDDDGDNIPTASGTTEPGTTVVVTWPDGTTSEETADETGAWSATAPGVQEDGDITVELLDPAGNPGSVTAPWVSADIDTEGPEAPGVQVDADGVTLLITGEANTLATIYDAAQKIIGTVELSKDGEATFELPPSNGQDVTVTLTDAAGNKSAPTSASLPDTLPPEALEVSLANDTGEEADGITSDGTVSIIGLEDGATWEYSVDGGVTWQEGEGTSFVLEPGQYGEGDIQVRQSDTAQNVGPASQLGAISIVSLAAVNDSAAVDMGGRVSQTQETISNDNLQVLGVLDTGAPTTGVQFSVAEGATGDVVIEVSQTALIAVADAFNVEIYDQNGELVGVITTQGSDPLLGDVMGLGILGLTNNNTLVANVTGLAPGDYTIVVRKGESALGRLLDADGDGLSLEELGQGGVVLGAENQELILAAIENALNGELLPGIEIPVGTILKNTLQLVLDTTTVLGAGRLVEIVSKTLSDLGLTGSLDIVLGAIADALLSNTLTLLQSTSVTATVTEHSFETGSEPISGNVIDPDASQSGEAGEDSVVPGTTVTQVALQGGESVTLTDGSASIEGLYGTLVINSDGSYTYTPNGDAKSVGQSDVFTYTISDGSSSATADLTITVDGALLTNDFARAGIDYEYKLIEGPTVENALFYGWLFGLGGLIAPTPGSSLIGANFTVDAGTTQDVTLSVDLGGLIGLAISGTLFVEVNNGGNWQTVNSYSVGQLLDILGLGEGSDILLSDLQAGTYRTRVELNIPAGVAGRISVDTSSEIKFLDQYENPHSYAATGDLFENDLVQAGQVFEINNGEGFVEVATSQTVNGSYGTLIVEADGSYTYTPDDRATPGGQFTDTFTYRIDRGDGNYEEATLTVTINATVEGQVVEPGIPDTASFSIEDSDVIPIAELSIDEDAQLGANSEELDSLQNSLLLEEDSGEITLPFGNNDDASEADSDLSSLRIDPVNTSADPLGYLVPDPLAQEDDLNPAHVI